VKSLTWPLALIAMGLLGAASCAVDSVAAPSVELAASPPTTLAPVNGIPPGNTPNFRAIVQQAGPAVVGITVAGQHQLGADEAPLDFNDPFFQFFRGLPGFQWQPPVPDKGGVPFRSQGSGFIISSDGLILTNAHVVREAKEVTVKLSDRREFKANVLGSDPSTDVAVLRINSRNLPVVRLGDAEQLQVGDPVLAIGSPFGFEQTATQGIVSAKGRSLPGDAAVPFIQTDAAVNPGNSGGPLFDASGAVVGINAQIFSRSGGYQGLSFAIPINVALKVKDQIVTTGKASHARLGVVVQDLTQGLAESFGLARPDGALISQVLPGNAAANAGLLAGDVVTSLNGEPIVRSGDLSSRVSQATPGQTVRLQVWRDRMNREMEVKLGRAEEDVRSGNQDEADDKPGQLGLSLRELSRDEQASLRMQGGLLVVGVTGAASRAGLQVGDLLLAINGMPLKSVDQVSRVIAKKPKKVALLVLRDGERRYLPVELD
jgi:serine protease Do